jgi:hypothetical protein
MSTLQRGSKPWRTSFHLLTISELLMVLDLNVLPRAFPRCSFTYPTSYPPGLLSLSLQHISMLLQRLRLRDPRDPLILNRLGDVKRSHGASRAISRDLAASGNTTRSNAKPIADQTHIHTRLHSHSLATTAGSTTLVLKVPKPLH